jgi:formylglycine-generating enzyme required for sulfatase activity
LWKPAHKVSLDSFCLDSTEVTVDAYTRCVDKGDCKPASKRPDYPKVDISEEEHQRDLAAYAELCNFGQPGRGRHPINCVTWYQSDAYCRAQGQRLPSEAEWELAARGSDGRTFPWGNDAGDQTYMNAAGREWKAWSASHALAEPPALMYEAEDGYAGTAPVGSFPRAVTQAGQLDMVGNVWEWTADWYALYDAEHAINPKGPAGGERKAIRGGAFNGSYALWLNPAFRYHQVATAASHGIGFRCAANVARAR